MLHPRCRLAPTPLNLGTSPGTPNSFISSGTINNSGDGIQTIVFTGGTGTPNGSSFTDGLYAGNVTTSLGPVASSPFGSGDSTTNYLVAQPNKTTADGVAITFFNSQNSFDLVWGTVDSANNENLLSLTLTAGAASLSGMDIANIITNAGGSFTSGAQNVSVEITGLPTFTTITASDKSANSAFEFDPLVVPAPLIGHGLLVLLAVGGVLFGGKLWENMKKRDLHAA